MSETNQTHTQNLADYTLLVNALVSHFGGRLKTIVLFGSRSRGEARAHSDHDIFVVIEDLVANPLARQRQVTAPLLPILPDLPERLAVLAKTPQELVSALTPLLIDVCVDGIALYGQTYFDTLRSKTLRVLGDSGLQRRFIAGTWMWTFPRLPRKDWELTWEGYHERV
jgi:predicted nucleotidyltransferase